MTNDDDEYEADDDDQEEEEGEENEEEDEGEGCKDGGDEGEVHVEGWRATSRKKDAGGRWTPPHVAEHLDMPCQIGPHVLGQWQVQASMGQASSSKMYRPASRTRPALLRYTGMHLARPASKRYTGQHLGRPRYRYAGQLGPTLLKYPGHLTCRGVLAWPGRPAAYTQASFARS